MSTVLAGAGTGLPYFAAAQQTLTVETKKNAAPQPVATDGQEEKDQEEVLFEADSVIREFDDGPIVAEGDVRAFFGERYLRADRLIYNPATDIVIAEGNVSITDENLETAFAGRVELSGDLRDGVAENFSALLEQNARLAADSAIHEQGARTRLSKAVYTACDVCAHDGHAKKPTWRLKALRVTRDKERKVVRFHHAFLEIKGVPIVYMPFLQAPDPSVERQSGFLPPNVGVSSRLGFNIEMPYYLAISNHQDATFFPKYTAEDGVLWQGEYRLRGKNGYHVLSGGVINAPNQPEPAPGASESTPGVRWHYFGRGYRNFGKNWRASYDVERVSDDTYLRNYDIERRGDLRQELDRGSTNQLRSNARLAWRQGGSNLTIDTYLFQGLRAQDDAATTPYVLPLIDFRHDFSQKLAGGKAHVGANIASLQRTGGVDSRRFTANAFWKRDIITKGGHRFNLFAELRGDVYYFQDLNEGTEICSDATAACAVDFPGLSSPDPSMVKTRFAPAAGAEWSYPLARDFGGVRIFLEPRVQAVASLADRNPAEIVNEDSQSIEFDYAGLFDYNKATGYDAYEDGQRINVGIAASAKWQNGFSIESAIGQQFRVQNTNAFDRSSGLGGKSSDVVGSLGFGYKGKIGFENRFRVDNDLSRLQRAESMAFYRTRKFQANVSYVRLNEENIANNLIKREELRALSKLKLTNHWSVGSNWRFDLVQNRTVSQDFLIGYEDECSLFSVTFRRNRTRTANLTPDNAVIIRFSLKSLVN